MNNVRRFGAVALVGAMVLGAVGCGDDSGSGSGCEITVSEDMTKKPEITIPDCATKPTTLQITDIVEQVGIHQSGVSRHLRILHEGGFVSKRAVGQRRLYSLRAAPFRELDQWLGPYRNLWEARLDRFGAALEKQRKRRRTTNKERRT